MMRNRFLAVWSVVVCCLGCVDTPMPTQGMLNGSVDGKNVVYFSGQVFAIALDLHGSAGYQWDYEISDDTVVRMDSTRTRPKNGGAIVPGGLSVETFYFHAEAPGQTTIVLVEHRGWERDVPPINSVRFIVSVSP